jgi:hypothetical protein
MIKTVYLIALPTAAIIGYNAHDISAPNDPNLLAAIGLPILAFIVLTIYMISAC